MSFTKLILKNANIVAQSGNKNTWSVLHFQSLSSSIVAAASESDPDPASSSSLIATIVTNGLRC